MPPPARTQLRVPSHDGRPESRVGVCHGAGGPLTDLISNAIDGVIGPALVASGAIAKSPILMVDQVMTKKQAIA